MARIKQLITMDITLRPKAHRMLKKPFDLLKDLELFKNQRKVCRDIRTSTDTGRSLDKIRQKVSKAGISFLSFIFFSDPFFSSFSLFLKSPLFSVSLF